MHVFSDHCSVSKHMFHIQTVPKLNGSWEKYFLPSGLENLCQTRWLKICKANRGTFGHQTLTMAIYIAHSPKRSPKMQANEERVFCKVNVFNYPLKTELSSNTLHYITVMACTNTLFLGRTTSIPATVKITVQIKVNMAA